MTTQSMHILAAEVAVWLGAGWTHDRTVIGADDYRAAIDGPDGARVYFTRHWTSKCVDIMGTYPHGTHDLYPAPVRHEIYVSAGRTGKAVAAEITRRLLPAYLPDLAETKRRLAAQGERRARTLATAHQLAATVAGRVDDDPDRPAFRFSLDPVAWGTVSVSDSTVSLDLNSVPLDLARDILSLIAKRAG